MRRHVFTCHTATEKEKAIRTIRVHLHHGRSDAWYSALYRRARSKSTAGSVRISIFVVGLLGYIVIKIYQRKKMRGE
jgi:hypothetical protein